MNRNSTATNNNKRIFTLPILALLMLGILFISGCGQKPANPSEQGSGTAGGNSSSSNGAAPSNAATDSNNPIVTFEMDNGDVFKVELYPEIAPNTVNNFISLANSGFYDGVIFHRVIPGFMIQGGDPDGNGRGGPGYQIKGEFSANGFQNDLIHERGVISMARQGARNPNTDRNFYNTAGSQFYIVHQDSPHLDGLYTSFGKVIEGIEIIDKIAMVATDNMDKPKEEQKIDKVTVETYGVQYAEPEKIQ